MSWTNRDTEVFNLHYQDVVMEELRREHPHGTASEEEVKEIVQGVIGHLIDEVSVSENIYIFDVVHRAIENVNTKELIETYYYDYKEEHKK